MSKQTGLSRGELLARLSRELPDAVDNARSARRMAWKRWKALRSSSSPRNERIVLPRKVA
jgi:hypothetical protein